MTLADLAAGLSRILLSQAEASPESALLVAMLHRGMLDAVGINDTTQRMLPQTQREAIDFLTGPRGRLCASLCGLEPSWYSKHVKTYLRTACIGPGIPEKGDLACA